MENILKTIFVPTRLKLPETPLLALAFLGDAVHTLAVRTRLLDLGFGVAGNLHKLASQFCSASGQSEMLGKILPFLLDEEQDLIRRARNTKSHKPPKSCTLETYKKATALECLLGHLLANGQFERLEQLLKQGLENIKENIC